MAKAARKQVNVAMVAISWADKKGIVTNRSRANTMAEAREFVAKWGPSDEAIRATVKYEWAGGVIPAGEEGAGTLV